MGDRNATLSNDTFLFEAEGAAAGAKAAGKQDSNKEGNVGNQKSFVINGNDEGNKKEADDHENDDEDPKNEECKKIKEEKECKDHDGCRWDKGGLFGQGLFGQGKCI